VENALKENYEYNTMENNIRSKNNPGNDWKRGKVNIIL